MPLQPGSIRGRLDRAEWPSYTHGMRSSLVCLALLLLAWAPAARVEAAQPLNGIAVIVGEAVITYKDVYQRIADDVQFIQNRFGAQPDEMARRIADLEKQTIKDLVANHLILQEFKKMGYAIPESYIESRVREDVKKFGDRLNLVKTLQADGLTYESYRKKIRERTIVDLMVRDKLPIDPTISPTKIENYYVQHRDKYKLEDQVKLRMIVLNVPQGASPDDLKPLAEEISKKLRSGIPFDEMAKIYSQGSQARDGGDWGWVQRSVLREELVEVAFNLKPGTRSDPVVTPQAIYIMQVEDSKVSYVQTLSEVRAEIENTLKAAEMDRRRTQWIEQLEKKYFVAYF